MINREGTPERDKTDSILKESRALLNSFDKISDAQILNELRSAVGDNNLSEAQRKETLFVLLKSLNEKGSSLLSLLEQMPEMPWETLQAGLNVRYVLSEAEIAPEQYFYSDGKEIKFKSTSCNGLERDDRLVANPLVMHSDKSKNQRIYFLGIDVNDMAIIEFNGRCHQLLPDYVAKTFVKMEVNITADQPENVESPVEGRDSSEFINDVIDWIDSLSRKDNWLSHISKDGKFVTFSVSFFSTDIPKHLIDFRMDNPFLSSEDRRTVKGLDSLREELSGKKIRSFTDSNHIWYLEILNPDENSTIDNRNNGSQNDIWSKTDGSGKSIIIEDYPEVVYSSYRTSHENFETGDKLTINYYVDPDKLEARLKSAKEIRFLGIDRYNNTVIEVDGKSYAIGQVDFDRNFRKL